MLLCDEVFIYILYIYEVFDNKWIPSYQIYPALFLELKYSWLTPDTSSSHTATKDNRVAESLVLEGQYLHTFILALWGEGE